MPPSSLRNAPAAEMAVKMRSGLVGSSDDRVQAHAARTGLPDGPWVWVRSPGSSFPSSPPSVERKSAASSAPAYTVSGSVGDGSRCQTRANSHGCGVPSYHWWVPGTPS